MTYAEVRRLRDLRRAALRARALAAVLDSLARHREPILARSAVACWGLGRLISGTLRGHPFLPFQRGPGAARGAVTYLGMRLLGAVAHRKGRSFEAVSTELRRVARGLDDARSLTRSSEFSESLGRAQPRIRRLIEEIDLLRADRESRREPAGHAATAEAGMVPDSGALRGDWPYLAL